MSWPSSCVFWSPSSSPPPSAIARSPSNTPKRSSPEINHHHKNATETEHPLPKREMLRPLMGGGGIVASEGLGNRALALVLMLSPPANATAAAHHRHHYPPGMGEGAPRRQRSRR